MPLIPPGEGRGLLRRLGIVSAIALLIGLANWSTKHGYSGGLVGLDKAMVYAYAISLSTWAATDMGRFVLRRQLLAEPPSWWPPAPRAALLMLAGIPLGYICGTAIGDAYAGVSTLDLLHTNPQRFTGLLVSSVAISFAFLGYFYQRGHNEALQRQAREAQLALLQSQLEPHMLFNTLANLRVLIALDAPRAQAMLDHLIAFLRATLSASRTSAHPLEQEFARLADYLALMAVRMGPRLQVRLDLPPALRALPVPPLLLQPLVENAILHGLEPHVQGGQVCIAARQEGGELVLSVRDTGAGLAPGGATAGFGLSQVRERLATLHGARAGLSLEPAPDGAGGTLATVRLPLPDRAAGVEAA